MINLAGNKDADSHIRNELTRCGIDSVVAETKGGEVPYTIIGKLGKFTFSRAWYYWVVSGPTPIKMAEELYDGPFRNDIRSGGDCGCRPPATWAHSIHEGKQVITASVYAEYVELAKNSPVIQDLIDSQRFKAAYHIIDNDDLSPFNSVVNTFHIDSELGLYIFVQALKKYGLV